MFIRAPGRLRSGRRRRADARCGWPDVGTELGWPRPRGEAAGPGRWLIFNRLHPAIRPARCARRRRRHGFRFGTAERPRGNPFPHGVAASIKCRNSCSYFFQEQSRPKSWAELCQGWSMPLPAKRIKLDVMILCVLQRPGARRVLRSNGPAARTGISMPRCVGPPAVGLRPREMLGRAAGP